MDEHRTRVALATGAETLGDLQSLVSDLQTANAPVQLPDLKPRRQLPGGGAGWGLRLAVAGVLVVLGVAIGWGLYGNTPSPLHFQTDPGAKADGIEGVVLSPPTQLHSLGGLTGLLEQTRKRFGDTRGYDLTVYPRLRLADPAGSRRRPSRTELHLPRRVGRSVHERQEHRRGRGRSGRVRRQGDRRHPARGARDAGHQARGRHQHLPDHRCRRGSDHARRRRHQHLCVERLRQRLHRAGRRRHRQADQLPLTDCRRSRWGNPLLAPNISARYYWPTCRTAVTDEQRRCPGAGTGHPGTPTRIAHARL